MSLCLHPPEHVTADILEGDLAAKTDNNRQIQWCRLCGAWRNTWDENSSAKGSWRIPEPLPVPDNDPDINKGVWFCSAASGLWYRNPEAAGDICRIRANGIGFQIKVSRG